jgi:hypothetical protein
MIRYIKYCSAIIAFTLLIGGCKKKDYNMGSLEAPSEVMINTTIVGQDATHPNGDGSGDVVIALSGKNVISYKIDYNEADGITLDHLPTSTITKKYTNVGLNTYRITVVAYGPGATATTVTKEIQVQSDFTPDPAIVTNLTGAGAKTWKVDKATAGHFGVGEWKDANVTPEWWSAPPNDKEVCCKCFYTTTFTFTKVSALSYTLTVTSPDGAFTKTGALAGGLPNIPGSGDEGCYPYAGGTSAFSFVPSGTGVAASKSTKTAILLGGNNTYIGYGAQLKEYEILSISETSLNLRVQGTETGNAWYLKMIPN